MTLVERRDLLIAHELAASGLRQPLGDGFLLAGGQLVWPNPRRLDREQAFERLFLRILGPGWKTADQVFERFVHALINHFPNAGAIGWIIDRLDYRKKRELIERRAHMAAGGPGAFSKTVLKLCQAYLSAIVSAGSLDLDDKRAALSVRVLKGARDISPEQWDTCANPPGCIYNPFVAHAYFLSLEESGSASAKKGWLPCHLALKEANGALAALMPCYLKSHSYGEYVFDHAWAQAYERAGGRYYPKLQTAVPFTPVTGRRILVRPGFPESEARAHLAAAAVESAKQHRASSWHMTFATKEEWEELGGLGFLQRTDTQYHWHNRGYENFDGFLAALSSRKRKTVRKEREQARTSGVTLEWLTGSAITEAHWDAFFAFYMDTGSRKWGTPYLNRTFFSLIGERMADRVLLVMGKRDGAYVAGALNFIGGDTLYGRYWGCLEAHNFLHFEACYYQAIEYAVANKIAHVEAGAQGEHKLARGYAPETTYSLHYLADPGLASAVASYLAHERKAIEREQEVMSEALPYKRCAGPSNPPDGEEDEGRHEP